LFYTESILKIRFLVVFIGIFLFSCGKIPDLLVFFSKEAPKGGDSTFHTDSNNDEIADIALRARDTLPFFLRHLRQPGIGERDFRVKYPFPADNGSGFLYEQLWLGDIRRGEESYTGVVLNTPFYVSGLSQGDRRAFNTGEITDWMYIRKGKITGGKSIKYLLEQIPPTERNAEEQAILDMF
jgi:uncharacterized protein YegJ (DUF2314 family)